MIIEVLMMDVGHEFMILVCAFDDWVILRVFGFTKVDKNH